MGRVTQQVSVPAGTLVMRVPSRVRTCIALVGVLALAGVPATAVGARRAPAAGSSWRRISGPTGAGVQLGLARTSDGVLNVIWNRGNPAPTTIFDTRLSGTGASLGTKTIKTNWGGANGLALLVMPDGSLRLFASGAQSTGSPVGGISTFTAQADGTGWTLANPGAPWGGAGAAASSIIGATLTKDGQPVTSWAGFVKQGLDTSFSTTPFEPFMGSSGLATDGASGAIVLSGTEIASKSGGTWVQQVLPSAGKGVDLPSSTQGPGVSGLAARIGAAGVYVMYTDTTRVGVSKPAVRLYRYGGGTKKVASGEFTSAKVFSGPAGRLWLAWGDAKDGVFVTRSNKAVSRFEPVQKLKLPANTGFLWNEQGEGSAGPLDLFVDVDLGSNNRGFWQTHVLAKLSVSAKAAKRAKGKATTNVTVSVRDAGDAVPGAKVSVGSKKLTTNARGIASTTLRPGSYPVKATATGYAPAAAKVKVS
jgi:hypothetical protein